MKQASATHRKRMQNGHTTRWFGSQSPMSNERKTCPHRGGLQPDVCGPAEEIKFAIRRLFGQVSYQDFGLTWSR